MRRQTSTSEFYRINDMLVDKAETVLHVGSEGYPEEDGHGLEWFRELSADGPIHVLWKASRELNGMVELPDLRQKGLFAYTPEAPSLEDLMSQRPLACVSDNEETNLLWKAYCAQMRIPFPLFVDGDEPFILKSFSLVSSARVLPATESLGPSVIASEIRREVIRMSERCALRSLLASMVGTRKKTLYVMEHDKLTGILNRHGGEHAWRKLDKEVREAGQRYVFFIADLDHFKKVNDHFGHDYGDEVLSRAAEALAGSVGRAGFVFRFGGEEIAGFRKVENFFDQQRFASKLMHTIRDLGLGAPPETGNKMITVSIGITIFDPEVNNVTRDEILKQADLALYEAKDSGRNCYEVFVMNRKFMETAVRNVRPGGSCGRLDARMTP